MSLRLNLPSILLVTAALSACTGTFEPPSPLLLVVGYEEGEGTQGRVALIRDSFGGADPDEGRLEFLGSSVRDLPSPPVSYDVTNRENARGTLVVLSRASAAGGSATGYLTLFSLRGIDPDAPAAFRETAAFTISPAAVDIVSDALINPRFCPSSVQVTQGGDFAAVLNEPNLCGGNAQPFIDIFSLEGEQLSLLQRITGSGGFFLAEGGGIYLSQSPTQDLLYYAVNAGASLRLQRATLPRPGSDFRPDDRVPEDQVAVVRQPAGRGDFVDLGRAGPFGDERLVVLFEEALVSVGGFTGEGEAGGVIDTPPNNARLIRDDLRRTDAALILATPAARRFSYVPELDADDGDEVEVESERVVAADAVIEPTQGFVYFVGAGNDFLVSLFDLSSYEAGDPLPDPAAIEIPELSGADPSFITWTQSAPALLAP